MKSLKSNIIESISCVHVKRMLLNSSGMSCIHPLNHLSGLMNGNELKNCYPVAILFGHPSDKNMANTIIPKIDYYHYRSSDSINLFLAGYYIAESSEKSSPIFSIKNQNWFYNVEQFNDIRIQLTEKTKWSYSGEAELVLFNIRVDEQTGCAEFDFTSSLVCEFNKMISEGTISSIDTFIEDLFQFMDLNKDNNEKDLVYNFSDSQGLRKVQKQMIDGLFKFFKFGKYAKELAPLAIKDISLG